MSNMFSFKKSLSPARIVSYILLLVMLSLTAVASDNSHSANPVALTTIGFAQAQSEDESSTQTSPDRNNNTETTSRSGEDSSTNSDTIGGGTDTNSSSLLLRGIIASTLPIQQQNVNSSADKQATTTQGDELVAAGRWRMGVEQGMLTRFVANFGVAKNDGSGYHNIGITNIGSDFEFAGNTSRIVGHVSVDGTAVPATLVPITLELHGKLLKITDINIDAGKIKDPKIADALKTIDGQTIYGLIESQAATG